MKTNILRNCEVFLVNTYKFEQHNMYITFWKKKNTIQKKNKQKKKQKQKKTHQFLVKKRRVS